MTLSIAILAAGQGKRMHSSIPKVLHPLAGKPLLEHIIQTTLQLNASKPPCIVFGHQGEKIQHALAQYDITWVHQAEQLGTGHALQQALPHFSNEDRVLILYGDTPLISKTTLEKLIQTTPNNTIGMVTAHAADPTGFGRIIRNAEDRIIRIVEEKDATEKERAITEMNPGIYLIPAKFLKKWLPTLKNNNSQKEYYLTDIIALAIEEKITIHSIQPQHAEEVFGINDRFQLAQLERFYQQQQAKKFMLQGVTIIDPARFDVRGELKIGTDVTIDVNSIFEGNIIIGNHCIIGPNVVLRNVILGDHVEIKANSVIDGAEIANNCVIGPFARIRPGTILAAHVHVGNFAEIKNSIIGEYSKIHHVSYTGDTEMGKHVNIGAGTIVCNYDGEKKHRTTIGDSVFVGSNSSLVAPVTIGAGATLGAGSTITHDAPANKLTLARAHQVTIEHWERSKK